jgi:hypothetical protein
MPQAKKKTVKAKDAKTKAAKTGKSAKTNKTGKATKVAKKPVSVPAAPFAKASAKFSKPLVIVRPTIVQSKPQQQRQPTLPVVQIPAAHVTRTAPAPAPAPQPQRPLGRQEQVASQPQVSAAAIVAVQPVPAPILAPTVAVSPATAPTATPAVAPAVAAAPTEEAKVAKPSLIRPLLASRPGNRKLRRPIVTTPAQPSQAMATTLPVTVTTVQPTLTTVAPVPAPVPAPMVTLTVQKPATSTSSAVTTAQPSQVVAAPTIAATKIADTKVDPAKQGTAQPSGFFSRISNLFKPSKPKPEEQKAATAPMAPSGAVAVNAPVSVTPDKPKPMAPIAVATATLAAPAVAKPPLPIAQLPAPTVKVAGKGNKDLVDAAAAIPFPLAANVPITSLQGPLDATKIPDLATSAPILDTDDFRKQVAAIIAERHPNKALVGDDVLAAIIQAVCLEVDSVSPLLFAPLLVSILKQVDSVKIVKGNRPAKMLLVLELFKAFVIVAFKFAKIPVPEALRYLAASSLDSLIAVIVKKGGQLVSSDKLQTLLTHQQEKLSRRAFYLAALEATKNAKLATK